MILVIDNYDSFVHNLARYVRETGEETIVWRNDERSVADCLALAPSGIILSPGPGRPAEAGICKTLIAAATETPILGVCLGHQALGEACGGATVASREPMHGRTSVIDHDGTGVFAGLPSPLAVGRYHSLSVDVAGAPDLIIQARAGDGEIMAMRHRSCPHHGVQFHPESLLTPEGRAMIETFVAMAAASSATTAQGGG
ncbi:anthranilate synthase component II [Aquisalinus flavus]|uniref:Aminodeoxychorismate/anthranilate synthase component II n=1 Tax=Aquisalinus flavus TaxID=1526572 RepID=A0A8J2V733_9PROT|nr:aminodeoxychorismate/anthranilate synthase component II [Aquisalinus flavus]MBD0425739.1 aminodeoxychorismate/anthranilate synthase component II [Aquisalinus flavus]UNE48652.1 aminodeoxychorismate/anthranilate synthase component II [Aquisalinus flavus]GGD13642.1 aminodeoxychorismate/anthranilate synthase component II [Aquisalinus flavus]